MLNAILHKGLGATDPYQQHILTDAKTGYEYLLLSDGTNVWKIGGPNDGTGSRSASKLGMSVSEKLHQWLTSRYRHGLIDGSEPGYDFNFGGFRVGTGSRSSGANTTYLPDQNKTAAYTTALVNGKVITLTQVLKSVNPSTHVFFVPVGYYYQGDITEAPSVSTNDANDASNRAGYNTNNILTPPTTTTTTTTTKSEDDDNTMLFMLLPLVALVGAKLFLKDNKRKKR